MGAQHKGLGGLSISWWSNKATGVTSDEENHKVDGMNDGANILRSFLQWLSWVPIIYFII